MRRTINIAVSEEMHSLIRERTDDGCYRSVSSYIRHLVRQDKARQERAVYVPPRTANRCIEDALLARSSKKTAI